MLKNRKYNFRKFRIHRILAYRIQKSSPNQKGSTFNANHMQTNKNHSEQNSSSLICEMLRSSRRKKKSQKTDILQNSGKQDNEHNKYINEKPLPLILRKINQYGITQNGDQNDLFANLKIRSLMSSNNQNKENNKFKNNESRIKNSRNKCLERLQLVGNSNTYCCYENSNLPHSKIISKTLKNTNIINVNNNNTTNNNSKIDSINSKRMLFCMQSSKNVQNENQKHSLIFPFTHNSCSNEFH